MSPLQRKPSRKYVVLLEELATDNHNADNVLHEVCDRTPAGSVNQLMSALTVPKVMSALTLTLLQLSQFSCAAQASLKKSLKPTEHAPGAAELTLHPQTGHRVHGANAAQRWPHNCYSLHRCIAAPAC